MSYGRSQSIHITNYGNDTSIHPNTNDQTGHTHTTNTMKTSAAKLIQGATRDFLDRQRIQRQISPKQFFSDLNKKLTSSCDDAILAAAQTLGNLASLTANHWRC